MVMNDDIFCGLFAVTIGAAIEASIEAAMAKNSCRMSMSVI